MTLIFVYNAKSGILNAIKDAGHKIFKPSTYPCSLCALTYNTFCENKHWKTYRENSNVDTKFYHIDEFESVQPKVKVEYPVVLKVEKNRLETIINNTKLDSIESLNELIELIKSCF